MKTRLLIAICTAFFMLFGTSTNAQRKAQPMPTNLEKELVRQASIVTLKLVVTLPELFKDLRGHDIANAIAQIWEEAPGVTPNEWIGRAAALIIRRHGGDH